MDEWVSLTRGFQWSLIHMVWRSNDKERVSARHGSQDRGWDRAGNILEVKPDITGERKLTGEIHKWVFIIASYKALQSF